MRLPTKDDYLQRHRWQRLESRVGNYDYSGHDAMNRIVSAMPGQELLVLAADSIIEQYDALKVKSGGLVPNGNLRFKVEFSDNSVVVTADPSRVRNWSTNNAARALDTGRPFKEHSTSIIDGRNLKALPEWKSPSGRARRPFRKRHAEA